MADQADRIRADLVRLMELVVTRHVWGRGLTAEQMQEQLGSVLDDGRRHLVTVSVAKSGRLEIEFSPELGDVGRAFAEASKLAPHNWRS
jgi:hypothetical protein